MVRVAPGRVVQVCVEVADVGIINVGRTFVTKPVETDVTTAGVGLLEEKPVACGPQDVHTL